MKEKFVTLVIFQLSSNLLNLFATYVLILNLNIELMGSWFLFNSFINLCFIFINLGFDLIHYRYSVKKNFQEYFSTFFFIKILLILISLFFSLFLIIIFQFGISPYLPYILILLFSKSFFNIANIFLIDLKAKVKIFKSEIPYFFVVLGNSISIIYLALNLKVFSDPLLYLSIMDLLFNAFFLIILFIYFKDEIIFKLPKMSYLLSYLKDTKPILIFSILLILNNSIGNIFLDYSFGHASLAYFNTVNIFINLLLITSSSFIPLFIVIYSKLFEENKLSELKKITYKVEKYFSFTFLSIIILVFLNGDSIISIILPQYLNSIPILYIMIFIPYLLGITRPYSLHMISGKKQTIHAYVDTLMLIITLTFILILIPENFFIFKVLGLGSIGYALALTIPKVFYFFICRYNSKKYFNIDSQKKILIHILIALGTIIIVSNLKYQVLIFIIKDQVILIIITSFTSIIMFLSVLYFTKELKKEDIVFFLKLLKLKNYVISLSEEFPN